MEQEYNPEPMVFYWCVWMAGLGFFLIWLLSK
jgi:hypothetical protein